PPPLPQAAREVTRTILVAHAPAFLCGRPLGEILQHTAKVTLEQLDQAQKAQAEDASLAEIRFGEVLVKLKICTEEQVLEALSVQLDLPYLSKIEIESVPPELVKKVPINFAKLTRVLPLGVAGGPGGDVTRVAVADPLDTATLDNLSMLLGTPLAA